MELVGERGRRWKEIGGALGRMPEACRDRWLSIRCGRGQMGLGGRGRGRGNEVWRAAGKRPTTESALLCAAGMNVPCRSSHLSQALLHSATLSRICAAGWATSSARGRGGMTRLSGCARRWATIWLPSWRLRSRMAAGARRWWRSEAPTRRARLGVVRAGGATAALGEGDCRLCLGCHGAGRAWACLGTVAAGRSHFQPALTPYACPAPPVQAQRRRRAAPAAAARQAGGRTAALCWMTLTGT